MNDIEKLVRRACGQFIYAYTVIKFVDNEYFNPCKRLRIILDPTPHPVTESPFADLDVLYRQILSIHPDYGQLLNLLGSILAFRELDLPTLPRQD
ncbi:hypothetical protein L218DRAFT_447009 [Marasmius fiardii PR-910]|nr:hypothetical protein L218DRAFT_447009 [Marasmius fiardii PR-910]